MRKKQKTNTKRQRNIIVAIVLFVLVAGGVFSGFYMSGKWRKKQPTTGPAKTSEIQDKEKPKIEKTAENKPQEQKEERIDNAGGKTPTQFEQPVAGQTGKITGNVTSYRMEGDNVAIYTMINQEVEDNAKCVMTLTKETGEKISAGTVKASNDATTAHCEIFRVPKKQLTRGVWNVEIEVRSGAKTGKIKESMNTEADL